MPNRSIILATLIVASLGLLSPNQTPLHAQTMMAEGSSMMFSFSRNLQYGDTSAEVKILQQILNNDSRTLIAEIGPGSPGNETTYFGGLTRAAVIKFQELYREEILVPNGLTRGNGFVGPSTRAQLIKKASLPAQPTIPTKLPPSTPSGNSPLTPVTDRLPIIYYSANASTTQNIYIIQPSEYAAPAGKTITLSGVGFSTKSNTLYFGKDKSRKLEGLKATNSSMLSFTLPDYPVGKYDLFIQNEAGISEMSSFIIITSPNASVPIIESVSPTSGPYGAKVTIHGKNFTPTGNEVRTNYRIIENLPSADGTTILVPMDLFPDVPQLQTSNVPKQNFTLPVYIFVLNSNGVSNRNAPGRFTLEL